MKIICSTLVLSDYTLWLVPRYMPSFALFHE